MRQIESFPATWFRCPECREENTFRYSLCEERYPTAVCHGCGVEWDFDSMARATFSRYGFTPFPNEHFRMATDFICDDCGKFNTVLNPIGRQELIEPDDDGGMTKAVQEVDDVPFAECRHCGAEFELVMDAPNEEHTEGLI